MSAYDDAVAYLDAEVHPRCDYDIYSDMRDIVDEMEDENAKLRELVKSLLECHNENDADMCANCEFRSPLHRGCMADVRAQELGVEVDR